VSKPVATTVAIRAIEIAEKHLGTTELAERLKAPESTVRAWRMGHAAIPERKFLLLVELLASLEPEWEKAEK